MMSANHSGLDSTVKTDVGIGIVMGISSLGRR
jgi:hypothetical protein